MTGNVVVSGAASGIGAAVANMLAGERWRVFELDRAYLDGNANDTGDAGRCIGCDVSDAGSVDQAFAAVAEKCTHLDAVVVAAGILETGSLADMTLEAFDRLFAVNTRGAWLTARAALTLMRQRPAGTMAPRIVFLGSISGIRPKTGSGAYGAQKSALHVITGVLAAELAPEGVLVNAVAPGTVDTPMIEAVTAAGSTGQYRPSGNSPLGRIARPADVANVIGFLLSEQSSYVTGTVIPADGGTRSAFIPPV